MRLKLISLTIVMSIILLSPEVKSQQSKIPVAILNLEVAGIDSSAVLTLTDRLRAELLETGEFDVMERDRMEEILIEQGFQQTGACNTDECVVEAGRLLGVSKMIAGSVGKIGTLYTVTVRMIDVQTGRILLTATEDSPGPIENILTVSLKNVAKKLSVLAAIAGERPVGFGSLKLISKPAAARIFIDDQTIDGHTPVTIDSIKAGVHVIRMQKELFAGSKAIFIASNEETTVDLELTLSKGTLKIITDPKNAEIFLDYQSIGFSPKTIHDLPVGAYHLKLVKQGYVDNTQIVSIKENETNIITAKMIPLAFLTITSNPPKCQVIIDDSLIGATPLTSFKLKPGYHKIEVNKKGFTSFEEIRSLPAGQISTVDVVLDAIATIFINSEPPKAELYVNGIYRGLTPLQVTNLEAGTVNIKLKRELYEDYFAQLALKKGETKSVNFTMIKKKGKLVVKSIPSKAAVEIDGKNVGITPLEITEAEVGRHLIRVMKKGYKSYEKEIEIKDLMPQIVRVNFEIAMGTLFLRPNPKDALIFLDGKKLDQIPSTGVKLLPGEYHVKAVRPGYEKFSTTTLIKPDDGYSLDIQLNKKTKQKAIIRSIIFPGWGQKYAEKHTRKYLFPLLEISSLAGILISDLIYEDKISDYNDMRQKYLNAINEQEIELYRSKMDEAYNDAEYANNWQHKLIIAAISIWALNILDSALFEPIRPEIVTNEYRLKYSMEF